MKKQILSIFIICCGILLSMNSCKDEPINPEPDPTDTLDTLDTLVTDSLGYLKGNFIVCEGNFGANNGTITYVNDSITINDLFYEVNNRNLGDVVQSMTIIDTIAYIVVNNSQKVEVVNAKTFEGIGTITDLSFPRCVAKLNANEILISNGDGYGSNYIYVVNSQTLEKTDSIATGSGPDKIVVVNNKIFAANLGGYTTDNSISVYNASTLAFVNEYIVGDLPSDMEVDADNNLIVFCKGLTTYDSNWNPTVVSNSKIIKFNTTSYTSTTILSLNHQVASFNANVMAYNNGTIYYVDDAVYTLTEANPTPVSIISGYFYGISINPDTDEIWLGSTSSTASHSMSQYSSDGTKLHEYSTGFYPNSVLF